MFATFSSINRVNPSATFTTFSSESIFCVYGIMFTLNKTATNGHETIEINDKPSNESLKKVVKR